MSREEDKERVRTATDFLALVSETVQLKRRGQDYWGCCPFHQEKSPSFHINPATGLWKCFGCGKGGDLFDYVMEREHLEFPDAVRYLADRAGIELSDERGPRGPKRSRLQQALGEAESFYHTMLMRGRGAGPDAARAYLAGRGFGADVCRRWHLGFAPGRGRLFQDLRAKGFTAEEGVAADLLVARSGRLNDRFYDRVMFPIHDEVGRPIGFGGRVLTDAKPKYLNTKETSVFHKSQFLFGLDRAKDTITATGEVLVVEGYTDVISLHEHGFTNAVAALGTALTAEHVKKLSRYQVRRIVCMFDGDAAGQRAAERSVQFLDQTDAQMLCVVLPDDQDPMEFLSTHAPEDLRAILDRARPLVDFVLEKKLAAFDLGVAGQRVRALDAAAGVLAPLRNSVNFDGYAANLAQRLGTDLEATKRAIRNKKVTPSAGEDGRGTGAGQTYSHQPQAPAYGGPSSYDGPYNEYDVPADIMEEGGLAGAPVAAPPADLGLGVLSLDTRQQLAAERELLSLLAEAPAVVRPYGDRLGQISWADGHHEVMAWAMLGAPESATPSELVLAASTVVPESPRILASGGLTLTSGMDDVRKAEFLVDVLELCSDKREIESIQGRLRVADPSRSAEETHQAYARAADLQRRVLELNQKIASEV